MLTASKVNRQISNEVIDLLVRQQRDLIDNSLELSNKLSECTDNFAKFCVLLGIDPTNDTKGRIATIRSTVDNYNDFVVLDTVLQEGEIIMSEDSDIISVAITATDKIKSEKSVKAVVIAKMFDCFEIFILTKKGSIHALTHERELIKMVLTKDGGLQPHWEKREDKELAKSIANYNW